MKKSEPKTRPKHSYSPPTIKKGRAMSSGACPRCTTGGCGINYRAGW